MTNIIYKDESYKLMGIMFDIHNNLGKGFSEIVYKMQLNTNLKNLRFFSKEKKNIRLNTKKCF
jgi:hypothetical protein